MTGLSSAGAAVELGVPAHVAFESEPFHVYETKPDEDEIVFALHTASATTSVDVV